MEYTDKIAADLKKEFDAFKANAEAATKKAVDSADAASKEAAALKSANDSLKASNDALKAELEAAKAAAMKAAGDAAKASEGVAKVSADATKAITEATAAKAAAAKVEEMASTTAKALSEMPKPEAPKPVDPSAPKAVTADDAKAAADAAAATAGEAKNRGDTAWMLTSSAFVLFMIPGLALFYGGMVRKKNVLATMMQSMAALAVVGTFWVAFGYGLAFGPSQFKLSMFGVENGGIIGWSWDLFFLKGIGTNDLLPAYGIPVYVHVMFQGMFAIITPALISGAIAERIRFWPFCIFMILWISFVYCPLAHMVWAFDFFDPTVEAAKRGATAIGFLGIMGALDFAGGTVVHIAAGMAGLACALVLGRRQGYPKQVVHPNSMVLTLLGAGMLWFGWFGFNGGSGLNSTGLAGSAFAATQAAAASAGLVWMLVEWIHKGKPTALGLASGIVAGLVAVTPASGFVYIWGGFAIGAITAVVCYLAVVLKGLLGYDDSLDAFGVHGVGGFIGAVLTGLFCYNSVNSVVVLAAKNDGYFAVKGKTFTERYAELETKIIPELKAKGDEGKAELEAAETEFTTLKTMKENGPLAQTMIQLKASVISAVFAFVVSLVLCLLTQALTLGNFKTSKADEITGLDQTEHGESGFDFGFSTESFTSVSSEPRAAAMPKIDGRFELTVDGATSPELMKVWSSLAQMQGEAPPDADFVAVYPYVTTIRGNKFKCRGGNAAAIAKRLDTLFKKHLPGRPIKVMSA
jgi:ammonium transporter